METQNIEYKVKWKDEFLKEICAFANTQGGTLYGYKKIQDGFNEAKLPIPVFATAFGGVEVNITRPRAIESGGQNGGQNAAQLTERQQLILSSIEKHGGHVGGQNGDQKAGLNNEDLAKLLGISLRTIEREVVVLKKKNLIKRIGYGLKGYWAII